MTGQQEPRSHSRRDDHEAEVEQPSQGAGARTAEVSAKSDETVEQIDEVLEDFDQGLADVLDEFEEGLVTEAHRSLGYVPSADDLEKFAETQVKEFVQKGGQ